LQVLAQIWEIYGLDLFQKDCNRFYPKPCVLERYQEIQPSDAIKGLLLKIRTASIDRYLRAVRIQAPPGLSTIKPGSLLKPSIAVHAFYKMERTTAGICGTLTADSPKNCQTLENLSVTSSGDASRSADWAVDCSPGTGNAAL